MARIVKAGSPNVSVHIRIVDSADGTPETGVTSATPGLALNYRREGEALTAITPLLDLTALTDAHNDGGILHIGHGYYRVDVPDAAFATGADGVLIEGTATGMVVIGNYTQLSGSDFRTEITTARIGNLDNLDTLVSNLPTAAEIRAEMDANSTKLDTAVSTRLAGASYTAPDNAGVAAIKAQTDLLAFSGTDVKATLDSEQVVVATNNDKTNYALSSAGNQAIWDVLTSALTTLDSVGKLLTDTLDAAVSTRSSHTASDVWAVGERALTDKSNFNLAADQSTVTVGIANVAASLGAQAKLDANAEADAAIETYRLHEFLSTALSAPPAAGSLLGDLTEDDGGTRRFTANALEQAPAGSGITALQTDVTTLLGRLTAARAALLDNLTKLDMAITTLPTAAEIETEVWEGLVADYSGVAGSFAALLSSIDATVGNLGAPVITLVSPVVDVTQLNLIRGDDYSHALDRDLAFTISNAPSLEGASVTLQLNQRHGAHTLKAPGVVVDATHLYFELTSAQTSTLKVDPMGYDMLLWAEMSNGDIVTIAQGLAFVSEGPDA